MVSILLSKMKCCNKIVCTDGDNDTMELLNKNLILTSCNDIISEFLYWGQHDAFISKYHTLFDIIIAADVIYEDEQVIPLFDTAYTLLKGICFLLYKND